MSLQDRLRRLLENPRISQPVAEAAKQWMDSADDQELTRSLDLIESELAKHEQIEASKKQVQDEKAAREREALQKQAAASQQAEKRIQALRGLGAPPELLRELQASFSEERAVLIESGLKQAREGIPGLVMKWRDDWSPAVEYQPGDVVRYAGEVFVCLDKTIRDVPRKQRPWAILVPLRIGGGGGGTVVAPAFQNLYVQQTNPGLTIPGLWIELRGDNTVKTVWAETG